MLTQNPHLSYNISEGGEGGYQEKYIPLKELQDLIKQKVDWETIAKKLNIALNDLDRELSKKVGYKSIEEAIEDFKKNILNPRIEKIKFNYQKVIGFYRILFKRIKFLLIAGKYNSIILNYWKALSADSNDYELIKEICKLGNIPITKRKEYFFNILKSISVKPMLNHIHNQKLRLLQKIISERQNNESIDKSKIKTEINYYSLFGLTVDFFIEYFSIRLMKDREYIKKKIIDLLKKYNVRITNNKVYSN